MRLESKQTIILIIVLFMLNLFDLNAQQEGSIVYNVQVLKPWTISKESKLRFPHLEEENRQLDSVANTFSVQVLFNNKSSRCQIINEYSHRDYSQELYMAYQTGLAGISYNNYSSKTVMHYNELYKKEFNIEIPLKDKWDIDYTKSKKIGKFTCYRADYKGVNLTNMDIKEPIYAWFTPEIPLPVGPTYFCGLPGLVIELVSGRYQLNASQINFETSGEPIEYGIGIESIKEEKFKEEIEYYHERSKALLLNRG